jgi:carbonic anhydrase
MITSILGAEPGEFFVHRNIAGLVPPYSPDGDLHGTSAAVEMAVATLEVPHVIVLGHSSCGGVRSCHDMCAGLAPDLRERSSFVGRWMELLRPGYEKVCGIEDEAERLRALEQEAVLTSLANLATFPYVAERVEAGDLSLHGVWTDIAAGALHGYDAERGAFAPL